MNNQEVVSIIIPVYNAGKYIQQTIESVINQTYKNYELLLIDDCSQDNSVDVISNYLSNKVLLFHLDKNSGAAVARNYGLSKAKGRYIAFLDSDDVWMPNKLELQMQFMIENNYGFTYTSINIVDYKNDLIKSNRKVIKEVTYKILLKNTIIATSTVIIDKYAFGNFKMPLIRSGQDYATWLMLLHENNIAYGMNVSLTNYRKTDNSLSSKKFSNFKKVYKIQTELENISAFEASINVVFYLMNAIIKHYF